MTAPLLPRLKLVVSREMAQASPGLSDAALHRIARNLLNAMRHPDGAMIEAGNDVLDRAWALGDAQLVYDAMLGVVDPAGPTPAVARARLAVVKDDLVTRGEVVQD